MPTVSSLAGDLDVNMYTVNKVYNLLVDEEILMKSQKGYMIDLSSKQPNALEDELKIKIE